MQNVFTSLLPTTSPAPSKRGSERPDTADICDLLRRDHEELLLLVDTLCTSRSAAARSRALQQLQNAAPAHDKPEERAVYAALKRSSKKSADIAHEGEVEHELVSGLIKKLARMRDPASDQARAHADVLKELLEHHIAEEHSEMFEQLRRDFDAERRIAIGTAFVAAKAAFTQQRRARRKASGRSATGR
jgi:hemerythrin superfamily protein